MLYFTKSLVNFATNNDPNDKGTSSWKPTSLNRMEYLSLNSALMEADYDRENVEFWQLLDNARVYGQ